MDFDDFLRVWNAIAKKATEEGHGDGELQDVDALQRYAVMHERRTLQKILEKHYELKALEEYFIAEEVFDHSKSMEANWEDLNYEWTQQAPIFRDKNNIVEPPFEDDEEEIEKVDESFDEDSKEEDELREAIGIKELPKQKAAPEKTVRKETAPQQAAVAEAVREDAAHQQAAAPEEREREEALTRIDAISNRLAEFVAARRATRDFLKSRVDASNRKAVVERALELNSVKYELDRRVLSLRQDLEKLGEYLNHRDNRIFDKNGRKTLRRLQADIQANIDKGAALLPKIQTEINFLGERAIELKEPVGSGQSLKGAVNAFKAIQDKQLSFGRTGGHANEFNAVKEAVQALDDYPGKDDKMAVYNACYAYLSKHTADGSHIGGQKSEVGRLRKQAVVNLLQVLSQDADVKEELREVERDEPNRMRLNFGELEKSLAKKTSMQKVDNKYLLGTKRRAYAELKAEKQKAEAAREAAAVRRPR